MDWHNGFRFRYKEAVAKMDAREFIDREQFIVRKSFRDNRDDKHVIYLADYNLIHYLIAQDYNKETVKYMIEEFEVEPDVYLPSIVMILNK